MNNDVPVRPKVFISYARLDGSALADELVTALGVVGFEGYLDQHDIAAAEDWEHRLDTLIAQADTVLFVLTPRSAESPRCDWEVRRALQLNKRIIPVVGIAVADDQVPEALQRLNHVRFTADRSFARALSQLTDALRIDIDWIREHTRLGELARRWDDRSRPEALLLRDGELSAAQHWMANWQAGAPPLTEIQRTFIAASVDAQDQRASLERQRNESMASANADRAAALERSEQALRQLKRRTLIAGGGVSGLSLALGGVSLWALQLRRSAEEARQNAMAQVIARDAQRRDLAGQVVAYATSPGLFAMDSGEGGQSPYTTALLNELAPPTASLWAGLSRTSTIVNLRSNGQQRPFVSSDMNGDLYLSQPSRTRTAKALLIAVGRFVHMDFMSFKGVYKDVAAWGAFLRARGIQTTELRDPRRDEVWAALQGLRLALDEGGAPRLQKVGATIAPTHPGRDAGTPPKVQPPADTLLLVYYSGVGFQRAGQKFLATTDTHPADLRLPVGEDIKSAVAVDELEKEARSRASASVLVYDTMFQSP